MSSSEKFPQQSDSQEYRPSPEQRQRFEILASLATELENAHVRYGILGGYGLDALYGKLTRDHDDIDMLVDDPDLDRTRAILAAVGFEPAEGTDLYERYYHPATETKLDFAPLARVREAAERYLVGDERFDASLYLPAARNSTLENNSMRVTSLRGQEKIKEIQMKRWGTRSPKEAADAKLMDFIKERQSKR